MPRLLFCQSTFSIILGNDSTLESITSVNQLNSGNYIFSGLAKDEVSVLNEFYLNFYKTNVDGELIESYEFRKDSFNLSQDVVNNITRLENDSSLFMVGNIQSTTQGTVNGYFFSIDTAFNSTQFMEIHSDSTEGYNCILNSSNQIFTIYGNSRSQGAGSADYLLLKLDSSGVVLNDTTYGGVQFEQSSNGIKINDNHFVVSGRTFSDATQRAGFGSNAANGQFIAIDSNLNEIWNSVLYTDGVDLAPIIKDYGYFYQLIEYPIHPSIIGLFNTPIIGQIDVSNGNLLWIDTIQISEELTSQRFMEAVDSTSFIVFMQVASQDIPYNYAKIIKYNNQGQKIWQRSYYEGNHNGCQLNTMMVGADGSLVFGGTIANSSNQSQDAWILKLTPDGCLNDVNCGIISGLIDLTPTKSKFGVYAYPNPSSSKTFITVENTRNFIDDELVLKIFDNEGKLIMMQNQLLSGEIPIFEVNTKDYPKG